MKKRWLFILTVLMIAATMFVACNSDIADTKVSAQSGKELVYATFGNSSSKALTVNYDFIDYTQLYWFYQAAKEDNYGTTGAVTGTDWAKVPGDSEGKGLDGTVGPFSQGLWSFNLAGYETKSDTQPTSGDYIHYGDYYYSGLVYSGASTGTVSLKYGDSNAIPVTVEPSGNTGKIYLDHITYAWDNSSAATGTVTLQIKITPVSGTPWTDSKEWVYDSGYTLTGYVLNSDSGVEIPKGTYNLDFTVCATIGNDVAYEFAKQSLSLTVFGSQTTTVTGSLVEGLFVENAHFVATDVASVIVIPTTTGANFETDKTPAGSGGSKKTTVTVPTGTLTTGTQNNMTIELVSIDIAQNVASQQSWTVASDSSAVAALTITLKEVVTTTDPTTGSVTVEEKPITTFDEAVTVTTYIETGLTGVQVFYNGDLAQPTEVTYDATTGCLTFKTTHFSEFYVTSKSEVLNVETGVKYTTLADAVDNAIDGQTLRLIKDITDPGLVINKSIILDLNGKTWTCSAVGTNPNTRAMTITGSSDFTLIDTSEDVNNNAFGSRKAGKIITSNALYGAVRFDSCGELIVKDVTLENCKDNGLNIKINADADAVHDIPGPNGCSYLIENVTINSTRGGGIEANYSNVEGIVKNCLVSQTDVGQPSWVSTALAVAYGATMTVENGAYSGSTVLYIYSSGGTFVVNNGSFTTTNANVIRIGLDKNSYSSSSELIKVYNGTFVGDFKLDPTSSANEIELYGGVYDHDPSAYVAEGYVAIIEQIESVDWWVVKEKPYVAQIGDVKYYSLVDAVAAVPTDGTETIITMIDNESVESGVSIDSTKNIILELNGKRIQGNTDSATTYALITNKGTLTIQDSTDTEKNGTGTGLITTYIFNPDQGDIPGYASNTITNNGILTVKSGRIVNNGSGYACFAIDNQTNGTLYTPVLTIEGGRFEQMNGYTYAVRMFCNSITNLNTANVSGGVITGGYGLWLQTPNANANKASLNISGGILESRDGAALYIGGTKAENSEISVIINGGEINGTGVIIQGPLSGYYGNVSVSEGEFKNIQCGANVKHFITGGTFYAEPNSIYLADGYFAVHHQAVGTNPEHWTIDKAPTDAIFALINNEDETVSFIYENSIHSITGDGNSVPENHRLVLLKDYVFVPAGSTFWNLINFGGDNITFDLSGHNFDYNNGLAAVFTAESDIMNLIFKNGSIRNIELSETDKLLFPSGYRPDSSTFSRSELTLDRITYYP